MACLRSNVASIIAAPNRAFNRCTSSLSSGKGFGAASFAGGAGFGAAGAAGAPAAAGGAAGAAGFAADGALAPGAAAGGAAGFATSTGFAASPAFAASAGFAGAVADGAAGFAGSAAFAGGGGAAGSLTSAHHRRFPAPARWRSYRIFLLGSSAICLLDFGLRNQPSSAKRRASASPLLNLSCNSPSAPARVPAHRAALIPNPTHLSGTARRTQQSKSPETPAS